MRERKFTIPVVSICRQTQSSILPITVAPIAGFSGPLEVPELAFIAYAARVQLWMRRRVAWAAMNTTVRVPVLAGS